MATKKLILNEVRGTMTSGHYDKRLGFRVLKVINTTDERIGQFITKEVLDEMITFGHYSIDIVGKEHADKGENI